MQKTKAISFLFLLAILKAAALSANAASVKEQDMEIAAQNTGKDIWYDASPEMLRDHSDEEDINYESAEEDQSGFFSDSSLPENDSEADYWHEYALDRKADESIERSPEAPDGIRYFRPYLHREKVPANLYYNVYRPQLDEVHPGGKGKHQYHFFHVDPQRDSPFWYEQRRKQRERRAERIKKGLQLPPELDFYFRPEIDYYSSDDDDGDDGSDEEELHDEWKEIVRLASKRADLNDEKEIRRDHVRAEIMKHLLDIDNGGGAYYKDHFDDVCFHPDLNLEEVKRRHQDGLLPVLKVKDGVYHFQNPAKAKEAVGTSGT